MRSLPALCKGHIGPIRYRLIFPSSRAACIVLRTMTDESVTSATSTGTAAFAYRVVRVAGREVVARRLTNEEWAEIAEAQLWRLPAFLNPYERRLLIVQIRTSPTPRSYAATCAAWAWTTDPERTDVWREYADALVPGVIPLGDGRGEIARARQRRRAGFEIEDANFDRYRQKNADGEGESNEEVLARLAGGREDPDLGDWDVIVGTPRALDLADKIVGEETLTGAERKALHDLRKRLGVEVAPQAKPRRRPKPAPKPKEPSPYDGLPARTRARYENDDLDIRADTWAQLIATTDRGYPNRMPAFPRDDIDRGIAHYFGGMRYFEDPLRAQGARSLFGIGYSQTAGWDDPKAEDDD